MFTGIETKLFYLINKNCVNPLFDILMPFMSLMGEGDALFVIAVMMLFFKNRDVKKAGIVLLLGITVGYYFVHIIKDVVARPRPFLALPDARVLYLLDEKSFSFPSGHAAAAFMAAVVLSKFFKRYWIFFSIASLIAISRVYVGVHYVSDIAAGAIAGALAGYLLLKVTESLRFEK